MHVQHSQLQSYVMLLTLNSTVCTAASQCSQVSDKLRKQKPPYMSLQRLEHKLYLGHLAVELRDICQALIQMAHLLL